MPLITRTTGPNSQGQRLSFTQMDNNLYYLQSIGYTGITYSANTVTLTNPTGGTISTQINNEYQKYVAILNQTSTDPPSEIELENNLGTVVYTYDGVGQYSISGNSLFTLDKTVIFYGNSYQNATGSINIFRVSDDVISIVTTQYTSGNGDFLPADDILYDTSIEIKVYN